MDLREYVSKTQDPTTGFSDATDWYNAATEYIEVLSDGAGSYTVSDSDTATVTIPTGETRQVGVQVDVDASATAGDTATFFVTVVSQ